MVSLHPHVLDPFWNISNEGFACTSWERLWLPYLHTSLLRWSSTFGSLFKTLPVDLYIGRWVHITFFKIHITIKIKHQAVQAADCDLRSQNAANARVPSTLPRQLYISTIFRPHPKTSFHLPVTRELFGSLNFSPNAGFKTTPMSLPWEQGPYCLPVLQQPKEGACFFGAFWSQPTHGCHRGRTFVLRNLLLIEGRNTFEYMSVGLIG